MPLEGIFTEEQKRLIRESLAYALNAYVENHIEARNAISEFYDSLRRKLALTPHEAEEETKKAIEVLDKLRFPPETEKVKTMKCPYCGAEVPEWAYWWHLVVCPKAWEARREAIGKLIFRRP